MPTPMQLDAPPAQPPAVQAGGPQLPMAGVGEKLAQGAGDSKGAVVSMWEVLKKAIQKWGQLSPGLDSFAGRMISVGESGLQMAASTGGGKPEAAGPGAAPPPPGSAKPGDMGPGGFPG